MDFKAALLLTVLTASSYAQVTVEDCPSSLPRDRYLVTYGNSCYHLVLNHQRVFTTAERECEAGGPHGHLAIIRDPATNQFLVYNTSARDRNDHAYGGKDDNADYNRYNGRSSCYQFVVNHEREWPTAERECEARHGHLVIIRDAATNQFIYNELVQEFHVRDVVFIGLSDAESEGHWKWVDGSDPAYTNWASGQPGIGGTFEDCAAMDTSKGSTWHDYSCEDILFVHKRQKFICEYHTHYDEDDHHHNDTNAHHYHHHHTNAHHYHHNHTNAHHYHHHHTDAHHHYDYNNVHYNNYYSANHNDHNDRGCCYEFVFDHLREWPSAERECEARHGHLVTIPDAATNQFLLDTMKELQRYDSLVSIGLSDLDQEGHWTWVDGSTSSYTNWAPGQPGVVGSAENCAAMDSKNGKWIDYFCRSVLFFPNTNKFICEYPDPLDDCPANLHRDQYLRAFGDSCYEFVLDHKREWPTAEYECEHRHGHLVIIRDEATNEFLFNTLNSSFHFQGMVFIGLTDRRVEGQWLADYFNWAHGQPGFGAALENCAAMDPTTGKWHDYYCEDLLFINNDNAFICEYLAAVSIDDFPADLQRDQYLRVFGDCCYEFVVDHSRVWPTAERECEAHHGHLAIIRDAATNQFLQTTLKEVMPFADFDTRSGRMRDQYLRVFGDSCYEFVVDHSREWPTAERECEAEGHQGHLAIIRDAATNQFLQNTLKELMPFADFVFIGLSDFHEEGHWPSPNADVGTAIAVIRDAATNQFLHDTLQELMLYDGMVFIGLTDSDTEGHWVWVDDRPSDASSTENCAAINSGDGLWHDYFCESALFFHNDNIYLRIPDSCYEFVLDHEREWPTAEFECGHKGGHLVIIRDAATNEWIYNTLKVEFRFDDVVFIGLTDSASEGHWLWVDGKLTSLLNYYYYHYYC
nr:hypothetical protein BaRGS_021662 [Batillaria attramentaria]